MQKYQGWNGGAANRQKTACPAGHRYTKRTTQVRVYNGGPHRCCLVCERERDRQRGAARREAFRTKLASLAAGGCVACGTHEGELHFHHRDTASKLFTIASGRGRAGFDAEVAKCDVLCEECHMKVHGKQTWSGVAL